MRIFRPVSILLLAVLFSGCEKKERTVYSDVSTQDMSPFSADENQNNEPGLEGMTDDDQGVIYF